MSNPISTRHHGDVRPGQHFPEIPVEGAILVPIMIVRHAFDLLAPASLHIADGHKLDVLLRQHDAQVVLPARAKPDPGENNPFARRDGPIAPKNTTRNKQRQRCRRRGAERRSFEEVTPCGQRLGLRDRFHGNS